MPQMSPIYWLILLMYFIMMLIILIMLIYFFFFPLPSMSLTSIKFNNSLSWMW